MANSDAAGDDAPAKGDLLFLYGTLRRGGAFHHRLGLGAALAHVGEAAMRGRLYDLGDYPGLIADGPALVHGELWRVIEPRIFAALDNYEGYDPAAPDGSLYLRIRAPLAGRTETAWVYVYNRSVTGRPVIASGRWG